MGLEFGDEIVIDGSAGAEDDESLDDLSAEGIGFAHDGDVHDGRVFEEGAFDFEGADAVAGAFDDIVFSTDEPEIAGLITRGTVACEVPITGKLAGGFCGTSPVFAEEAEWAIGGDTEGDFTFGAGWNFAVMVIQDGDVVAGGGDAHGTGDDRAAGGAEVADEDDGFGLAVAFMEEEAGSGLPEVEDFGVKRLAGGHTVAEAFEVAS